MTETPDHPTAPTSVATPPPPPESPSRLPANDGRPSRLALVALWVAIVAGVVFTVAVIFFSGFALGRHSGGGDFHHKHSGGHDRENGMIFHRPGPPMGPMGPMGPGPWQQGPGFGPGGPGGPSGPAPTTTAPTIPSPPTSPRP